MFNLSKKDKRTELEKERDEAVKLLRATTPNTDAYDAQLKVVERLEEMVLKEKDRTPKLSPDAALAGGVGVLQVLAILQHERFHNVMSKALNFVVKGRVR